MKKTKEEIRCKNCKTICWTFGERGFLSFLSRKVDRGYYCPSCKENYYFRRN